MKKNISTTALSLLTLILISSVILVQAQDTKGLKRSVIITNGDTIVNGKQFDELNKDERNKLRKEFKEMENGFKGKRADVFMRRKKSDEGQNREPDVLFWNDELDDDMSLDLKMRMPEDFHVFNFKGDSSMTFSFNTDSLLKDFNFGMDGLDSNTRKRIITMHRDMLPGTSRRMERRELPPMSFERRAFPFTERNNTSAFTYNHVDKNGIASRMNIRISDAAKEQLKNITGAEVISKSLEVNDLTLFPNFSSGKMTLSFNLNSKGATKVAILDSDMKQVFSEQAANFSGNYMKQISLPQNGIYHISISQNGSWFVKKLVKE